MQQGWVSALLTNHKLIQNQRKRSQEDMRQHGAVTSKSIKQISIGQASSAVRGTPATTFCLSPTVFPRPTWLKSLDPVFRSTLWIRIILIQTQIYCFIFIFFSFSFGRLQRWELRILWKDQKCVENNEFTNPNFIFFMLSRYLRESCDGFMTHKPKSLVMSHITKLQPCPHCFNHTLHIQVGSFQSQSHP